MTEQTFREKGRKCVSSESVLVIMSFSSEQSQNKELTNKILLNRVSK